MAYIKKIILIICIFSGGLAWGHSNGENYSFIDIQEKYIEGHFEINLINIRNDLKLKIDTENPLVSIKQTASFVQNHILAHYAIYAGDKKLTIHFTTVDLFGKSERGFAKYFFRVDIDPMPNELIFQNTLFFENNSLHRGLLLVDYNYKTKKKYKAESTALIFSPQTSRQTLDLNDIPKLLKRKEFIWQGIIHILEGYDHILFLVALLLTAVLRQQAGQWQRVEDFRIVVINFVKIVTLFTIAHSITLTMAALGLIDINISLVESVIALSIIIVALNNIFPFFNDKKWLLILIFGLFHGLGFATVMAQLPFRMVDLVHVMIYFNIGVELGQLIIVTALLPILFYLSRPTKNYINVVLLPGSIAIGTMASYWFIQRAF